MSSSPIKRVYKTVKVVETPEGFAVHLDAKLVRTPAGKPLVINGQRAIMDSIAEEWNAQAEMIRPSTMPIMQLTATALDRVGPERETILDQVTAYAQTDLLCYRALSPQGLRKRQDEAWQPLVEWVAARCGAHLAVTDSILAIDQSPEALSSIRASFSDLDLWHLTAAQATAAAAGSAILALALVHGRLTGAQIYELAHIDETWQIERWGDDAEAAARRASIEADIMAADRFLRLIAR